MEKRLIIAFALSLLVMLLWSYLVGTKQEKTPAFNQKTTQENPVAAPGSSQGQGDIAQTQEVKPTTDITAQDIKVETPLYEAVFTNRGATIKSFKLKRYKTAIDTNAPLVDLINITNDIADSFSVNFTAGDISDRSAIVYSPSQDSIILAEGASPKDLSFSYTTANGVSIDQTFRFYPDRYTIGLNVAFTNNTNAPISGNVKVSIRDIPLQTKKAYVSPFIGAALLLNNSLEEIKSAKMKEGKNLSGQIGWVAYENDYFISSIIPENQKEGSFYGVTKPSGVVSATYISPVATINPSSKISETYTLYFGPRDQNTLKASGRKLDSAIDFGWLNIIAKPLYFLLRFFNNYIHNFGISIIILTILIKIIFWPLTHKSYVSMKEMQKIQPLMAKIREKYKDDREQMQREMMGLYKTYKVNPLGGCLPMLVQLPVLYAMFRLLYKAIELRQAPFILWINDLSAPDRLFNFPFSIPFMYSPYGIPVLTLLMGASMLLQQKMSPPPGDPAQAKMMLFMPILFTVMFINAPSGLVLYWLVSNIIGIGQQYYITKKSV
jgi:YidC/Oxa1 family membrane protein insertase